MYDTSEVSSGSASAHGLVARKSHTCQRHASCRMVVSVLMDCLIEEPMDWFQSAFTCGFWNRRHGSVCCRARIGIGVGSRMQWHEEGCHGKKFWSPHAARHVRATHVRATSAAEW